MLRNNGGYQPKEPPGGFRLKPGYNPFSNKSTPLGLENNCEKLIGKNGELVKERQKQVLAGAWGIIQRNYQGTLNKMPQVAALIGKELYQPFWIESNVHKVEKRVRFTEKGMEYFDNSCGRWYPTEAFLREILTGQAVIVGGDVNNADRKE